MRREGSTLIEILAYSAIVAILLQSAVLFFYSTLDATNRITERNELLANQELIENRLKWLFAQSSGISTPPVNSSGTSLTISGASSTIYPASLSLSSSSLLISLPNTASTSLNSLRVNVLDFKVERPINSFSTSTARIFIHLRSGVLSSIESTTTLIYSIPN